MKVTVNQIETIVVDMNHNQLAWAIVAYIESKIGIIDDAGCDWNVDGNLTYIGDDKNWKISDNPMVARLVEAMNIISMDMLVR